ncbi:YdcF family protein [Tsukamurella sp. 8F]|nr:MULTISPECIES: YdcF family protein [unclassified Tsukamurella]MDF0530673.1 YdcF family protein [Tsukamurella sp. 8J]MDF0587874.1 YdcF family protein [Tsukamurella sp. 8F]
MRRLTGALIAILVAALLVIGVGGYVAFGGDNQDALRRADAIVVLGGDHDGREQYGIDLARAGYARHVLISDPYTSDDPVMPGVCGQGDAEITVECVPPVPATTRGEALFTKRIAEERGWRSVIVVSWGYHLPRARYIFSKCYGGTTIMRAVPRTYRYNISDWELTYLYQTVGFAKAVVQGGCAG